MMEPTNDTMTYELADIGTRFIAILIDGIILTVISAILSNFGGNTGTGLSFLVGIGYHWYFLSRNNGQTPGKSLMKIRVIKVDGTAITDADAIVRYIGTIISSFVFALGYIWAFFDENRQTWHDKMAKTYVVRAEG